MAKRIAPFKRPGLRGFFPSNQRKPQKVLKAKRCKPAQNLKNFSYFVGFRKTKGMVSSSRKTSKVRLRP